MPKIFKSKSGRSVGSGNLTQICSGRNPAIYVKKLYLKTFKHYQALIIPGFFKDPTYRNHSFKLNKKIENCLLIGLQFAFNGLNKTTIYIMIIYKYLTSLIIVKSTFCQEDIFQELSILF